MSNIKKRKDGRYRKIVSGHTFYGRSLREVNQKILEYEAKQNVGRAFKDVAEEWKNERWQYLATQTIKVYKSAYKRAVDALGKMNIRDITIKDISLLLTKMGHQGHAMKTVANQRTVISQIFAFAILSGDVTSNPCRDVPLPKGLKKERRYAAEHNDEEKIKETNHPWLFPKIALYTGMRKGEILALQWKDIDFERNLIYVTKSVAYDSNTPYIKEPKTKAGSRIVPLLKPLRELLLKLETYTSTDYIISLDGKTPLTNKRFTTLYNNYRNEVNISCTPHQLRHSFATIAVEQGIDIKVLQGIMGHSSTSITLDTYAELRYKGISDAIEKLNNTFN